MKRGRDPRRRADGPDVGADRWAQNQGQTRKRMTTAADTLLRVSVQNATKVSRREVVTYDGSATAKVVITENGATKSCTRPLPRGQLSCS